MGGENYGWCCYEGNEIFNINGCEDVSGLIFLVYVYFSNFLVGCLVMGGYVYWGSDFLDLYGYYVYIDFCFGWIWFLYFDGVDGWMNMEWYNGVNS